MTSPADIGWGGYGGYEGSFYKGSVPLTIPPNPSAAFKRMAVSASTEGLLDAINAYDSCTMSVGITQACETPWFLTSMLLGALASVDEKLMAPLVPALEASGAVFAKVRRSNKWRFHFLDERGEVDAGAEQKQLFCLHSSGAKGSWDAESKAHNKLWAASLANCLAQPAAQPIQIEWAAARLPQFAMPESRKILFDDAPDEGWVGAMRAGYLSYALNIPAKANQMLLEALKTAPGAKWSPEWCIHIFQVMTFGSKISIWPHRYQAIRKPLERFYGVDLPDGSADLAAWKVSQGLADVPDEDIFDDEPVAKGKVPTFTTTKEIQSLLVELGYDLGPKGADGQMGPKTRTAIMTYQRLNGLTADGAVGPKTRAKMAESWRKLHP